MMRKKTDDCKIISGSAELANRVSDNLNADILLINSDIARGLDNKLIAAVKARRKRKNVFLILVTQGGDPDAAYRMARCLQDNYEKLVAFVTGYCKSAGTLCLLGANEIVISDMGELGPLDVQVAKKDELFEVSSGLIANETLEVLQTKVFEVFEDCMLAIKIHGGGQITFKTASEIAVKISTGLIEPLCRQIDPLQVGEVARSMRIATAYGQRLMLRSGNFSEKTLGVLCDTYPSHSFVIDKEEVKRLFKNVRSPSADEDNLGRYLEECAYKPQDETCMSFLSDEIKEKENGKDSKGNSKDRDKEADRRANPSRAGKDSRGTIQTEAAH